MSQEWFDEWQDRLITRSGCESRFAEVHPDFWDEVKAAMDDHRVTRAEADSVASHLIRNGMQWPDQLIPAMLRVLKAIRPAVAPPPPIQGDTVADEFAYVRRSLSRARGVRPSEIAEAEVVRIIRAAGLAVLARCEREGIDCRTLPDSDYRKSLQERVAAEIAQERP